MESLFFLLQGSLRRHIWQRKIQFQQGVCVCVHKPLSFERLLMFRRIVLSRQRVEYDLELYGCPIEIPYTQRFRPRLQLYVYRKMKGLYPLCMYSKQLWYNYYRYSGDTLLEEVDADFVVWEIHGRHDYTYTANAEKVL